MLKLLVVFSSLGLSGLVSLVSYLVAKKPFFSETKLSPFECGFTPQTNSRFPVSMPFFLISLIFVVFDVELILLFPFLASLESSMAVGPCMFFNFFLLFLVAGFSLEWSNKMLEWCNFG